MCSICERRYEEEDKAPIGVPVIRVYGPRHMRVGCCLEYTDRRSGNTVRMIAKYCPRCGKQLLEDISNIHRSWDEIAK